MDVVFKSYWRLEPRVRPDGTGGNLLPALEASVHDPLWSVGRQWQLGELQGEDNGSPIATLVRTRSGSLTRFAGRDGEPRDYAGELPLELLVEHEPADAGDGKANPGNLSTRDRARAGLRLLDLLEAGAPRERVRTALVERFPLGSSLPGLARRAPDGVALELHLREGGALDELTADERDAVSEVLVEWRAWLGREVMDATPDCWVPERLEYRFSVGGVLDDRPLGLGAPEFRGGPIEWFHLDLDPALVEGLGVEPARGDAVERRSAAALPTRAAFQGMPVNRWWEIEDGRVNLARVDAGPLDLARMLVVEFFAAYGNDWFVVPVDLPFGKLSALDEVIVTNTFGERFLMPFGDPQGTPWSMYRHSVVGEDAPDAAVLSLLPAMPTAHEGEPLEEVVALRDEMANLAWAVVKTQQRPDGRPERPSGVQPSPEPPKAADAEALRYRLASEVPNAWVPLVPVQVDPRSGQLDPQLGQTRLRRGRIERYADEDGKPLPPARPRALLLEPGRVPFDVEEEEIPRSGLRLTRVPVVGRWLGGRTLRWTGRRKRSGGGEGSSNLRFDQALSSSTTDSSRR